MTTIYTRLSPLGFAEWLRKNHPQFKFNAPISPEISLQILDGEKIESLDRTTVNALAFRWLREENKAKITQDFFKDHAADNNDPYVEVIKIYLYGKVAMASKDTYELASIACLEKAAEIIESNK
jgi:hypothetical protein